MHEADKFGIKLAIIAELQDSREIVYNSICLQRNSEAIQNIIQPGHIEANIT